MSAHPVGYRMLGFLRHRLLSALDGLPPGFVPDEELAGLVRAEQIGAVVRLSPIAMAANVLSTAVITWAFWREPINGFLVAWATALIALSALGLARWPQQRRRSQPRRASRRGIRRATWNAALAAVLWSVGPFVLFPDATGTQQLLLASLIAGLICGGGFALAAIPSAALTYIAIMVAVGFTSLVKSGDPIYVAVAVLLVIYAGMLAFSVVWHGRLLILRLLDREDLKRQGELIGLLLKDFEENASDWLWETDAAGRLYHVSARFAEVLQRPEHEVRGACLVSLIEELAESCDSDGCTATAELRRRLETTSAFREVVVAVEIAGQKRWWSLCGRPVFNGKGAFLGYRGAGSDVTAAKEAEERIRHMALHDSLTGLPNRAWFRDQIERVLTHLGPDEGLAILFLDLDRFKAVNDSLGHPLGDALLCAVGERLRECVWESGMIARLGGDEFAVLQISANAMHDASALAVELLEAMSTPFEFAGHRAVIGTSIGVAIAPGDGRDPDELLKNADLALYRAKADGGGTFCLFEPEMDRKAQARRLLEVDLREALERGGFEVFYQPLTTADGGAVTSCEALLRWRHPERGNISPAEFIPLAEETGLILPIGEWVLNTACATAMTWPGHIRVAVNLSAVQFKAAHLVAVVTKALARSGLTPERLELEITESVLLDDSEATVATLHQLRALGVRIALDDFGTGYSSLSYLRRFPFDKLKIDQCFVRELTAEHSSQAIVRSTIAMAASLGMSTTAEGVETLDQLLLLRAMGCTEVQGYLFSPPRSERDILAMFRQAPKPHAKVA